MRLQSTTLGVYLQGIDRNKQTLLLPLNQLRFLITMRNSSGTLGQVCQFSQESAGSAVWPISIIAYEVGCFFFYLWGLFIFYGGLFFWFLFIYLWLCWVFVAACGLSLEWWVGAPLQLRCSGFSLRWLVAKHVLETAGSGVAMHRLSCSVAWGVLLDQGSNLCSLHCQADS